MAPEKKVSGQDETQTVDRIGEMRRTSTRSKWKGPLLMAILALCVNRGLQYHRYWNSRSPVVESQQGPLQGRSARTASGREYFAFQGIPYAQPPVGPLRFRDPLPPRPWGPEVRDARADGPICRQPPVQLPMEVPANTTIFDVARLLGTMPALVHRAMKFMRQSEDCLYLNVFTPKVGGDALLPVLVHIHGGAFFVGDGGADVLGPQHFMEQDVVLVIINYRLGALGFLALPELSVGNAGLKDAAAALRWVRDNIARFGGDPGKVTVGGQSAGGAIAQYLTLAPSTEGLFRSAIFMSGSALHHWAYSSAVQARDRTKTLVRKLRAAAGADGTLGADLADPEATLRFLQGVHENLLVESNNYMDLEEESKWLMDEFPFQPSVDGEFLPAPPLELIRAGRAHQVPVMIGIAAREGLFIFPSAVAKNRSVANLAELVDADFYLALPEYMREALPRGSAALKRLEEAARKFYFGKTGRGSISGGSTDQFINFYSALAFEYDTYRLTNELAAVSSKPVFAYNFTFEGRLNMFRRMMLYHVPEFKKATHCDDLGYLFEVEVLPNISLEEVDPEVTVRKNLISLFTNFITSGDPTPAVIPEIKMKWPPLQKGAKPVLNIGAKMTLQEGIKPAEMQLWDSYLKNSKKDAL